MGAKRCNRGSSPGQFPLLLEEAPWEAPGPNADQGGDAPRQHSGHLAGGLHGGHRAPETYLGLPLLPPLPQPQEAHQCRILPSCAPNDDEDDPEALRGAERAAAQGDSPDGDEGHRVCLRVAQRVPRKVPPPPGLQPRRVPVLDDDNFILYESNAILRYLSRKFDILVEEKKEISAKIDQWIDWGSFTFAAPCSLLTAHKLSLPQDQRDELIADKAKNDIFSLLNILNNHLANNDFIVDKKFSLADIPLGIWCHRCVNLKISFDNFPNINNWYIKLKEMNSFQNTVLSAPLPPN